MKHALPVLACAVAGGIVGHLAFFWIARQGFYALVLPGALLGLAAGLFKNRSITIAVVCGLLALVLGCFTEWRFAPFRTDPSLGYFLSHLHRLKPITLILIAVGGAIGFWVPFRRRDRN